MLLGIAKKQGKKTYTINNIITHPLTNSEIVHDHICNPTALHILINNFATTHNLSKPHLIVAAPYLAPMHIFELLQTALCLSKNTLNIESIHTQTYTLSNTLKHNIILPTTNLLDKFIPASSRTTTPWLLTTSMLLGIVTFLSIVSYHNIIHRIQSAQNSLQKIDVSLTKAKNNIITLKKLEQENNALNQTITTLASFKNLSYSPHTFLSSIATLLPHRSKLTFFEYNTISTKNNVSLPTNKPIKEKTIPIMIKGISQGPENTNRFVRSLSKNWENTTFSLAYSRKTKQTKTPNTKKDPSHRPYLFAIRGSLPKNT